MKRVLLIGENSYIGTEFVKYLHTNQGTKAEIEVTCVGARSGQWENSSFAGFDSVLHLAALVHEKETVSDLTAYRDVNYHMPLAVAKKSRKEGVKQFIFMSTAAVYGNEVQKITKETPPNPNTLYGKSKLAAEKGILKLKTLSFTVAVVRPPMVYGQGCKGNYTRLVKLAKLTPIFPDIKNKRSMIGISNLCEFLCQLINYGKGGYYYPQDKELVETSKLVEMIWNSIGRKGILLHLNNPFTTIIQSGIAGKCRSLNKMFGDFYYDEEMSTFVIEKDVINYRVQSLEDEIKRN